jgi:hypothetical protein
MQGIHVISFVEGRYDAVDYVPDRSVDKLYVTGIWYLVEMQMAS